MRAGPPWDKSPKLQSFQRARYRAALCPRGGHRPGTERSYRLGQMPGLGSSGDKKRGEQARPHQGNLEAGTPREPRTYLSDDSHRSTGSERLTAL